MGLLTRAAAALVVAAALLYGAPARGGGPDGFAVRVVAEADKAGGTAPELGLEGLDGKTFSLEELEGRVVLLHFWASWCAPCGVEMPALKRLARKFGDKGLSVLLVAEDSLKNASAYAGEHALDLPVLVDQYGRVMKEYGVRAIPTSVVIGRDGRVKAYMVGQRDYASPGSLEFFGGMLDAGE